MIQELLHAVGMAKERKKERKEIYLKGEGQDMSKGSSRCGAVEMNPTSIHEDAGFSLSGLRIRHCCELWCRSQTWLGSRVALWLWCRLTAVGLI